MNVEENRLQTFVDWPPDAVVNSTRIAKAGFYYTKQNLTVRCFACGVNISDWNYGDQVMARHKLLSPQCAFVLDPTTSGNVPNISVSPAVTSPPARSETAQNVSSFKDEAARLRTFANWPVPQIVNPEKLAKAGFYYLYESDKTKCAYCDGIVVAWEAGDEPDQEHKRHFPNCPFVETVINPRLTRLDARDNLNVQMHDLNYSSMAVVSEDELYRLGVNSHKGPKKSQYSTVESRICTFTSWPEDLIQTPQVLASAGFYYEGFGDQVRCFHCDGGLRHWDPHDDPWTEHARWFPRCAFVLLVKGADFIVACSPSCDAPSERTSRRKTRSILRRDIITDSEVQAHMTTDPAITALNIGLHVGRVKQAIRLKLEQTGSGFSTADALIEATLNLQHDEDDSVGESTDSGICREVSRFLTTALERFDKPGGHNPNVPVQLNNHEQIVQSVQTETSKNNNDVASTGKKITLEEENRLLKEARLCKICMDAEVGIVFLPCGHLATCINCAPNLQDCPVCRSVIKATVRTFLS